MDLKADIKKTKPMRAATELLEDNIRRAIEHMKDVTTLDGKPSEVNVKMVITPNASRTQFAFAVSGNVKLSPRQGHESTLFAEVDRNQEVVFFEFNPAQATIDEAIEKASRKDN